MTPAESIQALAQHVKETVLPHLGAWRYGKVTGIANSGDATFRIDELAEEAVENFIVEHQINVAYYSEDKGLIYPEHAKNPDGILIIDPIDGTRGAIAGFEACVVSVAWADYSPNPRFKDVHYAAITEIKGDTTLTAVRGEGVKITKDNGETSEASLRTGTEIASAATSFGTVGAPLSPLFAVMSDLVSPTTVRGGFFVLNSSAFELTRIVTGQLAAVIDVRTRLLRDKPETRDAFLDYGGGRLLSLYGYDVAAAAMIALEAGATVTDAWGVSLSEWELLDTTEGNFGSLLAASNAELHAKLLTETNAAFA
ncbi:MAG: hypothetical protein H7308_06755 [Chthonomonadaceae bacterium]|nr:hypothetical protein [Chthonomonadaceae bacterium]